MSPRITSFFDDVTGTVTHVIADPATGAAAIVDSVLDFDAKSGRTSTASAQRVLDHLAREGLTVQWHLETHAHADHLSAAAWLQERVGGRIGIGARIREVQGVFKRVFNADDIATDGRPFDHLFEDGERFRIGTLEAEVMATPGHTPACVSYRVGDDVFVGDTLFMPDYGSARCDFPGGDPAQLYRSIRRLLALPGHTRLHLCHDYPPDGRAPAWVSSVAEQRERNLHVRDGVSEASFVAMRRARDATLAAPVLMVPSVQVNVRAGHLPPPEDDGRRYLKIPIEAGQ